MIIFIPSSLFDFIVHKAHKNLETGFYLIGIKFQDLIQVYDAIEFTYLRRTTTFLKSDPNQFGLLNMYSISGLEVVSILHTHPFCQGKPSPSFTDLRDLKHRDLPFIILSGDLRYACFYDNGSCKVVFDEHFKLRNLLIDDERIYYVGDYIPSPYLAMEKYKTYLMSVISNGKITLPLILDIKFAFHPKEIFYRIRLQKKSLYKIRQILKITFANEIKGRKLLLDSDKFHINLLIEKMKKGINKFLIEVR